MIEAVTACRHSVCFRQFRYEIKQLKTVIPTNRTDKANLLLSGCASAIGGKPGRAATTPRQLSGLIVLQKPADETGDCRRTTLALSEPLPHRFGMPARPEIATAARAMLTPLTSLRFFAAAGVVLFHMANRWGMPPPKSMPFGVGVDLFFILSGFILAYNYPVIHGFGQSLKLIGYRIARIWPLNIVTLVAVFILLWNPADPFKDISKAWASVLLIQAWFGNALYAFNGNSVGWSLSVELAFYIVFPFLIMLSSRMIAVVTAAVTIATLVWADANWIAAKLSDDVTSGTAIMLQHPGAFLVQFSAGILVARAFLRRDWSGLSAKTATALELLAAALCVFYFVYNRRLVNASFLYLDLELGPIFYLIRTAFGIIFFLPIIFVLAVGRGGLSAVFRNRVLVFAGEISFATYMCHAIILGPMAKSGLDGTAAIIVYLVVVYAVSALLHFAVELPGQRRMRAGVDILGAAVRRIWSRCRARLLV